MWRIVLCSATYNNVMWSFVGAVVYVFRRLIVLILVFIFCFVPSPTEAVCVRLQCWSAVDHVHNLGG
jgi:hypothetical protein